ncbi:MAG: DUF58 domain-containing protein [Acidimicrobiales bacterium]
MPGPGSELNDGRPYELGDDVRRIDWSLSARCGHTHVRDTIADRELETWAVIDGSASMDFGTDEWEKRSLAIATVAAFGFLSSMGGSRFGAVIAEPSGVTVHPAASGRDQLRRLLLTLERRPLAGTGTTDLGPAIERIRRIGRRPGAVVLISDLLGPDDWQRPMRALGANAKTIVAEIKDRREDELPPVGLLTLVDPETGRLREVQTSNRHVRARYAVAAQQRRSDMKRNVRSAGADHLCCPPTATGSATSSATTSTESASDDLPCSRSTPPRRSPAVARGALHRDAATAKALRRPIHEPRSSRRRRSAAARLAAPRRSRARRSCRAGHGRRSRSTGR